MKNSLILISIVVFIFSIINPLFFKPISSFFSEYIFYVSFIFLIFSFLLKSKKVQIPQVIIPIVCIIFSVACHHYFFNDSIYFYFLYLCAFFIAIFIGFNQKSQVMVYLCVLFLVTGLVSSILAYIQWLGYSPNKNYVLTLIGNRPYANFAQPNHLATFLFLSLISLYYLFEKNKVHVFIAVIFALVLMWGIVLTQSRTAWLVIIFLPFFIIFKSKVILLQISKLGLTSLLITFWLMVVSLPYVNQWLSPYFNIAQSSTLVERATTGHLRLNIWTQMIHAILEKPWLDRKSVV